MHSPRTDRPWLNYHEFNSTHQRHQQHDQSSQWSNDEDYSNTTENEEEISYNLLRICCK